MRRRNVKDAEWIADLVRHGLVKANYITRSEERREGKSVPVV